MQNPEEVMELQEMGIIVGVVKTLKNNGPLKKAFTKDSQGAAT